MFVCDPLVGMSAVFNSCNVSNLVKKDKYSPAAHNMSHSEWLLIFNFDRWSLKSSLYVCIFKWYKKKGGGREEISNYGNQIYRY